MEILGLAIGLIIGQWLIYKFLTPLPPTYEPWVYSSKLKAEDLNKVFVDVYKPLKD